MGDVSALVGRHAKSAAARGAGSIGAGMPPGPVGRMAVVTPVQMAIAEEFEATDAEYGRHVVESRLGAGGRDTVNESIGQSPGLEGETLRGASTFWLDAAAGPRALVLAGSPPARGRVSAGQARRRAPPEAQDGARGRGATPAACRSQILRQGLYGTNATFLRNVRDGEGQHTPRNPRRGAVGAPGGTRVKRAASGGL